MWRSREPRYDVASAISQGARDYQEDAITSDFLVGTTTGFAVLADGIGGHAAGDVASKIVLTKVYQELKFRCANPAEFEADAPRILRDIAAMANDCVRTHVRTHPETEGMGATLVAPVVIENRLFWISIGDSPLYRWRAGQLTQLNEDHSMGPQIDFMVKSGMMTAEVGKNHPDRNCLTSVIMGEKISKVDCRSEATMLQAGDLLICSSDGLQVLTDAEIQRVISRHRRKRSAQIAEILLKEIQRVNDPYQDNISLCIIKINDASVAAAPVRQEPRPGTAKEAKNLTRVADMDNVLQMTGRSEPLKLSNAETGREKEQEAPSEGLCVGLL